MSDVLGPSAGEQQRPRIGGGWFVALGVLMILLGIFAWLNVVAVTITTALFIGAALLVAGIFQVIHAFFGHGWNMFVLHLLSGILYGVGGVLIMAEPVRGSVIITIILAVTLIVAGAFRVVIALRNWAMGGAGLLLVGGVISLLVGIALYVTLPWSGLWVLGTLIAVELIVQGAAWLEFGLALRRAA